MIEPTRIEAMRARGYDEDKGWQDWLQKADTAYAMEKHTEAGTEAARVLGFAVGLLHQEGHARGLPRVGRNPVDRAYYYAARMDGASHNIAEMIGTRAAPMSNTDREFLEGHCNGNQFEKTPYLGDWYAQKAKDAGVDITGKVYLSGLAAEPGDPQAWVSGRGDVERVVKERGWSCQGASNIKSERIGEGEPDTDVAQDILEGRIRDRIMDNPELALKKPEDLYHETRDLLKPSWAAA